MRDIEFEDTLKIEYIRKKFFETAKLFGFQLMEPSPIELLSILETKSGPSIKNEIYFFKDKGARDVALRFDFTIGLTRYAVSQKSMRLPSKIGSFGGVWRYDEPQKGRYRFFHQWDVEIYGKSTIESDAEIIEFTSKFFKNLNLKNIIIEICDRELVESYVQKIFQTDSRVVIEDLLRAIDKTQKKGKVEIVKEYESKGFSSQVIEKLLEFSLVKGTPEEIQEEFEVQNLKNWTKLVQLFESLRNRQVDNIRLNFGIVRGLDYYSGVVFEVFDNSMDIGALAGGGRYDALTKSFGRPELGATGVAGGVERISISLEKQEIDIALKNPHIWVAFVSDELKPIAEKVTSVLRQNGIPSEMELMGRPLKKQMEMASSSNFAIIIAPKELSSNSVVLRNMSNGNEKNIDLDALMKDPSLIFDVKSSG